MRRTLSMFLALSLLCLLLCPSALAITPKPENKPEIYSYLIDNMECSTAVACGIMANIEAVSGYNPEARNPASGSTINAYGLCQWTTDRYETLRAFDPEFNTVNAQMRFIHLEFLTKEAAAWSQLKAQPNTITGAYDSAIIFAKNFLRINQYYEGKDQFAMIGSIAKTLYTEKTGVTDPGTSTAPGTGTSTAPVIAPGASGSFLRLPATGTYTDGMFVDVSTKSWYNKNVGSAVQYGLMKGQDTKVFAPSGDVTLAEVITMASRIHCIYTNGTDTIQQGTASSWYTPYVDYAVENGIVEATYKTMSLSSMNTRASRSQVAVIISKAMPAETLVARNTIADNAIPDVKTTASYAPAVYMLYRAGVLTGSPSNGSFLPWNSITRAEMAAVMSRMADTDYRMSFTMK